jgi:hypothetical protein
MRRRTTMFEPYDVDNENGLIIWRGYIALASNVLAVFSAWAPVEEQTNPTVKANIEAGHERELRVYIGAVPGMSHPNEWHDVLHHGDKASERVGKAIFPQFEDCKYVR